MEEIVWNFSTGCIFLYTPPELGTGAIIPGWGTPSHLDEIVHEGLCVRSGMPPWFTAACW